MSKRSIFVFGICVGVLISCTFGVLVSFIDNDREYTVYATDDHAVTLKSENGAFIEVQLENVPDVSCFETGSLWIIDYLP